VEEGEEGVLQDKDDSSGDCKTVCISAGARLQQGRLICDCPGEYADVQLEPGVSLVGKNARAEIRIMRDTISQLHARIEYKAGRYYIEDLNSTNGTYINEQSVMYKQRLVLTRGDQVRFADVSYHCY
jgi:hypothetical protein